MATANPQSSDSDDSDSNLPGPDPDAKILAPRQEVFINPHVEKSVRGLKYKKTLKTTNIHHTCWRSTDESKILLGGFDNSCITVLHDDGREFVYKIPGDYRTVDSAVSITDEKHVLVIDWRSVITVNITPETHPGSVLHSVNTLNVKDPWCVFPITKQEYAIMCKGNRIEYFTLRNVLMDNNPSNTGFMNIDLPHPDDLDTACALPDGTICVASWLDSVIYMYDNVGHRLGVFGESTFDSRARPGHLSEPRSIQRCGDTLVVSCWEGDVHTYQDGVWSLLIDNKKTDNVGDVVTMKKEKERKTGGFWNLFGKKRERKEEAAGSEDARVEKRKIQYSVCSESMFWAIDWDDNRKVHIYDVLHD